MQSWGQITDTSMRVLIVTQYFYPENFKSNDIAFELKKRGYEVDALVGIPNYPEGRFYKGYGYFKKRREVIDGVRVFRVFNFPRGTKSSALGLAFNYLSYSFHASLWAVWFSLFRKHYDALIVHQTSPVTQAIPAVILGKLSKAKVYTWVLDVWPEAFISGSGITNKTAIRLLSGITRWVYNGSHRILISSRRFIDSVNRKGDFSDKTEYFPNWSEDFLLTEKAEKIPQIPDGFVIMIAGTMGVSQNLEAIAKTALLLKDRPEVKWIFVGDGSRRRWLESFIKENQLDNTVFWLGRHPYYTMPSFYSKADALLVSLNENYDDLKMVVPARLQSYLSSGKPVLAMIGPGGRELVEEADCGYAVGGNDYEGLAKVIKEKVLTDKEGFKGKGNNGRKYFLQHFTKKNCMDHLVNILTQDYAG